MGTVYQDFLVDRRGDVEIVTINRPEVRNALSPHSYEELEQVVRECTARCMVVTGADPAFCAGDDVKAFMVGGEIQDYLEREDALHGFTDALLYTKIPLIAAVNGTAVGWGMELALMADIRIASERARFSEAFVLRGLSSDVAGVGLLAKIVGREQAARLLFTGETIDASRAAAIGLVSEVVPHDEVVNRALALAEAIAGNPPLAVQRLKEGLRRALDPEWKDDCTWVRRFQAELSRTEDHAESVRAYMEKRPGRYVGR